MFSTNYIPLVLGSGYGFCSLSLWTALMTRLLLPMMWDLLSYWFCWLFWFGFFAIPFCFVFLFLDLGARFKLTLVQSLMKNIPCLQVQIVIHWKQEQMREHMFLRGSCLKDASKALKKGWSLLCFYLLSPQIPEFPMSQNTFLSKYKRNAVRWFCVVLNWTGQSVSDAEWFSTRSSLLISGLCVWAWVKFWFDLRPSWK